MRSRTSVDAVHAVAEVGDAVLDEVDVTLAGEEEHGAACGDGEVGVIEQRDARAERDPQSGASASS